MTPLLTIILCIVALVVLRIVYGYLSTWLMVRELLDRIEWMEPLTDEEWELEIRREDRLYDTEATR